jgi:hypothetical protein
MSNEILVEKTQERIEDVVTGNAPDLDALAAAAETDEAEVLEEE